VKAYVVGGAVRDALLGRPAGDRDWVVVGATPQQMLDAGYRPVGRDFPVFLHPDTAEEYALARTERKSAPGYQGFVFHADPAVTLEQDLVRRDLTINAIARDETGRLIDPCGGQADLQARILRHVSPAFVEDPVRLLRLARLSARLTDFEVAPETQALMQHMVERGEVDALVAERVWQELARGLMEARPGRMFQVLADCGALARLMPELIEGASGSSSGPAPTAAAPALGKGLGDGLPDGALAVRWAALLLSRRLDGAAARRLCDRLRTPREVRELAELALRLADRVARSQALDARGLVELLDAADAWRRPERFEALLQACGTDDAATREDDAAANAAPRDPHIRLRRALAATRTLDLAALTAGQAPGPAVGDAIRAARISAVQQAGLPAPDRGTASD
jgi:tRNA nucleotidyltransferase (CCA-adding enzyme)